MQNSALRPLAIVLCVLAAFCAVGILTFAGPCMHDDGTLATCYTASRVDIVLAVIVVVLALGMAFVQSPGIQRICAALAAIAGIVIAFAPGNILPLCKMQTMS